MRLQRAREGGMAGRILTLGGIAAATLLLATLAWGPVSKVSAQQSQPKLPVNETCCYQEKPRCEATCPIMDEEPREACLRDCEGRLRACLTQGAFVPKQGQNVICVRR
jgi:hypothetical protein